MKWLGIIWKTSILILTLLIYNELQQIRTNTAKPEDITTLELIDLKDENGKTVKIDLHKAIP